MNLRLADFKIPEELEQYKESLRQFARAELDPLADRIDRENSWPDDVRAVLKEAGIPQLPCPEEYGGLGLSLSQWWPIFEIVAGVGGVIRAIAHGGSAFWRMIHIHGTEEQKRKYLIPFVSGKKIGGFALTEQDYGTGVDIRTIATRQGDKFVLNGRKHIISSVVPLPRVADYYHVVAYSKDRSLGSKGISMFLVDTDAPGFSYTVMPEFMGFRGCPHLALNFQDCNVSAKNLLGKEGQGLDIAIETFLTPSRWSIATSCLGLAQRLLELSVEYSKTRVTFGRPIATRQAVQQILADTATDIYALRTMVADVGLKLDQGVPCMKEASMCKNFGIQVTRRMSDAALEIYGGIGVSRAYPVERLYREARMLWFEEGTPTIQRLVIAKEILRTWS
jgi:alkylation response protein AidB-like acyl-CoA dehydrogenase